jgi:hypothetical protein
VVAEMKKKPAANADADADADTDSDSDSASESAVVRNNTIEDIRHSGEHHVAYIHGANGGGHLIEDNTLVDVVRLQRGGWCIEFNEDSPFLVQNNTIDGELQDPNPGCEGVGGQRRLRPTRAREILGLVRPNQARRGGDPRATRCCACPPRCR